MSCFVTHLESAIDGTQVPADRVQTLHKDRPLWVRYDLDAVGKAVSSDELPSRPPTMWRYRELLPYADAERIVSLHEVLCIYFYCFVPIFLRTSSLLLLKLKTSSTLKKFSGSVTRG